MNDFAWVDRLWNKVTGFGWTVSCTTLPSRAGSYFLNFISPKGEQLDIKSKSQGLTKNSTENRLCIQKPGPISSYHIKNKKKTIY